MRAEGIPSGKSAKKKSKPAKGDPVILCSYTLNKISMRRVRFENVTIDLLVSYIEGSVDNSIRLKVEKWLGADPENRIFFEQA